MNVIATPETRNPPGPQAFFTICAKNFMAHARVLYSSIRPFYPDSRFFVVLCDRLDGELDTSREPFEFVELESLGLPDLSGMATRYNITEFNTAVKPFAFSYLMERFGLETVVYLDPDLLFLDRMHELDQLLAEGAEAVLTPHLLQPAEQDEMHDRRILLYGVYNLGFLALRDTPGVRDFLAWWGRRLEHDCVIRLEEGLFVDQKWADLLPAFVTGTRILRHPGYNVAYWNLPQRRIVFRDGRWTSNGEPLRFVHFSGCNIDDPKVVSRHSKQVTMDNIGDMRLLFERYRKEVYEQGHHFYRGLSYAYSWEGAAGVNLHTPKELDMSRSATPTATVGTPASPAKKFLGRIRIVTSALPVALRLSGGWGGLLRRAWGSFRRRGWTQTKAKILELSRMRSPRTTAGTEPDSPGGSPPGPNVAGKKR